MIRIFGIAFGALGGTRFYQANLTEADFSQALLKSTNFNQANLTRVLWQDAQKLDKARVGDAILANWAVRDLLVSRAGHGKSYIKANLRGANLADVDLKRANLTWADLSGATLPKADLRDANLREVLATGADFTGAYLTRACLESWNIDDKTILTDVDCQYVFLLDQPNALGSRERRPHDPERIFAAGDLAKLYRKMMNLVQILLKNGVNREAFAAAFQKLKDDNPDIDDTSIQAIERKGEDVLLTLEVPETADKAAVEQKFLHRYEIRLKQLEAENEQLKLRSTELATIATTLARQPTQITNLVGDGKVTNENTLHNQTVNIGRDMTGSTLNLGTISGNVSNMVNQLPSSPDPDQLGLKELLTQLQTLIESAPELPVDDKADALEQVGELATLGQNPNHPNKAGIWRKAWKILNAPIPNLPETAQITQSIAEILPAIAKLLGIAV